MKNIYYLFLLCILFACSDSNDPEPPPPPGEEYKEGINTFPESPEAEKEVKIAFKAPKTSALYGYSGDVYVHIGVVEGSDWKYVPADWEQNIPKCKMTKEEENVWSITLSPDVRTWFGVAEADFVQKIGVIFRSSDGTKKGIEADTFIAVEDNTFNPGEIVYEKQPENTIDGINIINSSTITLVLYDKDLNNQHKDYAFVIGDFNDWKVSNAYKMKRDDDTGCWWFTLTGLESGKEYAFQYYIGTKSGGAMRLADPYTEKILDPYHDKDIPASTYPGLRKYPSDKTSGVVSTFNTQPSVSNSQFLNVSDKRNLVIYEMLFRDFTESGDIQGALDKLDYLKAMGVNAIEIMPVQEFDGNDSWGYNPCFYFTMDKAYGTKEMYHRFIDACHEKGIAVILDVVYNHLTGSSPFAQLYWDAKSNKTSPNNPWFNVDAPHPYSVFHDLNHESLLVRKLVKRNLKFLLEEYKFDGFRFDLTKGFTQKSSTENTASNYDATRINILKDYNAAIKEVHADAIVILEHFAVEQEERELAQDGMMLWRNVNYAFCQSAMGWQENSGFSAISTKNTTMPFGAWVGYMESHDEERAGYKQTGWGNYNLKTDLAARMNQLAVNAALALAVPGPKMIWQFGELGYDYSIEYNGRTGKKPVKWDYYADANRKGLYDAYSKLIALRVAEHPDLFTTSTNMEWAVATNNWENGRFVSLKSITGKGLVVVGNFTNEPVQCTVNFQSTGTWYNYLNADETLTVTSDRQSVTVPAHSYYIYSTFRNQ